jgi:hypothetical protein
VGAAGFRGRVGGFGWAVRRVGRRRLGGAPVWLTADDKAGLGTEMSLACILTPSSHASRLRRLVLFFPFYPVCSSLLFFWRLDPKQGGWFLRRTYRGFRGCGLAVDIWNWSLGLASHPGCRKRRLKIESWILDGNYGRKKRSFCGGRLSCLARWAEWRNCFRLGGYHGQRSTDGEDAREAMAAALLQQLLLLGEHGSWRRKSFGW